MPVKCRLVVTCWEMADLLTLLYMVVSCAFVTLPYGVLDQVSYLNVSLPDICLLPYLEINVTTLAMSFLGSILDRMLCYFCARVESSAAFLL